MGWIGRLPVGRSRHNCSVGCRRALLQTMRQSASHLWRYAKCRARRGLGTHIATARYEDVLCTTLTVPHTVGRRLHRRRENSAALGWLSSSSMTPTRVPAAKVIGRNPSSNTLCGILRPHPECEVPGRRAADSSNHHLCRAYVALRRKICRN